VRNGSKTRWRYFADVFFLLPPSLPFSRLNAPSRVREVRRLGPFVSSVPFPLHQPSSPPLPLLPWLVALYTIWAQAQRPIPFVSCAFPFLTESFLFFFSFFSSVSKSKSRSAHPWAFLLTLFFSPPFFFPPPDSVVQDERDDHCRQRAV